jgi:hypothetical protein
MSRRKVTASLNLEQYTDLETLMKEDGQTNLTFFIVFLINQEKKRRENTKRPVGRPRKEDKEDEEEELWYPSPDGGTTLYDKDELEAYYHYRNQPMPPLPAPVKKK